MQGHILVVDDEAGIRRGCVRALAPEGYTVDTAVSLQEGLEAVRAASYDLVLLDIMMPDGRGTDLMEQIHALDPETVVVIITGYATVELAVEAIKRGAYDFISKPFPADLLLRTVEKGLERRRLSLETKRLQAIEAEAKALAQAKEEMERLSEFKSRFTTIVAHELRSPVGGAQSLLRTLNRGLAGEMTEKQRDILSRVEARLDQLLALINDLLELAESKTMAEEEALHALPLAPILREALDRYAVEAEHKQIDVVCAEPDSSVRVRGAEAGLMRIFCNLLGNAIKYTPPGGRVQLSVETQPGVVAVRVSDTGIGIPAEALPRLGEEFFRAENARQSRTIGTGLGLSIVRQMIDAFGGTLQVESEVGKGSTFTVCLPAANGAMDT